jgi:hypothetical protein
MNTITNTKVVITLETDALARTAWITQYISDRNKRGADIDPEITQGDIDYEIDFLTDLLRAQVNHPKNELHTSMTVQKM